MYECTEDELEIESQLTESNKQEIVESPSEAKGFVTTDGKCSC